MNALSEPTGLPNAKPQVLPPKSNALEKLFRVGKPIIGVIHLAPLPGAPRYEGQRMSEIYAAVADAKTLEGGGWNHPENASDCFSDPNMSAIDGRGADRACLLSGDVPNPIGITCVANG
jgi:predicted TIM-barrel enzyme